MASTTPRRVSAPPGSEFAFDVLSAQVLRQLSEADGLDQKLGVAIAALIAVAAAIYAAQPPRFVGALASAWLLVALIQSIRGFSYDTRYVEGVNATFLRERLQLQPQVIQWHAIVILEAAQRANRTRLHRKGRLLTQVIVTLGLVTGLSLIGKVLGLA